MVDALFTIGVAHPHESEPLVKTLNTQLTRQHQQSGLGRDDRFHQGDSHARATHRSRRHDPTDLAGTFVGMGAQICERLTILGEHGVVHRGGKAVDRRV